MVQFVSAVAPAWDGPGVGKVVVERVVGVMEGQPRLTEELLRADTDEAALMTRDLAFVRLSPLLILKVLPLEAFKGLTLPDDYVPPDFWDSAVNPISATSENEAEKRNENLAKRLMEALLVRIEHPLEFDPVRKLSSDLLARLPLPLLRPLLTQKFTTLFETRDTFQLRSYLFCAYHMIAVHGQTEPEEVVAVVLGTVVEILGWRESDGGFLEGLLMRFFKRMLVANILPLACFALSADEEGLDKLHQGCIECLSLCLSIFATQSAELEKTRKSDTQPLIEELFPKAPRVERPRRITPFIEEISESEEKTATQVDKPTRRTPFIEELPDTDERKPTQAEDQLPQAGGFETVLDRVLDLLHPLSPRNSDDATTYTRGSRSTFMSNTITTAIKKLSSTGSAPQQPSVSEDVAARNLAALQWLARRVVGRLLAVANWFAVEDGAGVYKVAGAACFQALFHIVFSTKGTADLPLKDIADVCINGFRATPDMIRLGSLKLFGAAMSWPNNAFRDSIGPLGLLQAQRALEALVNMETSEEIRRIAEQWLDAL
ncbi:hypothetical protein HK104_000693 [Borealophlyctis nickersoniae]|nr:hypothetical protein HK104_000693 [Borealophlyctis nickersoniae]